MAGRARKIGAGYGVAAAAGQRQSDQMAVWDAIAAKCSRLGASSPTSAAEAMYVSHDEWLSKAVSALAPIEGQRGAVFTIEGRPAGLELFDTAHRRLPPEQPWRLMGRWYI